MAQGFGKCKFLGLVVRSVNKRNSLFHGTEQRLTSPYQSANDVDIISPECEKKIDIHISHYSVPWPNERSGNKMIKLCDLT